MLLLLPLCIKAIDLNILHFNSDAQYTGGSGISVIINPTDTFSTDNSFILELSDKGGSWTRPVLLKQLDEFYTPVINALIPAGTAEGQYKLRVRSTQPAALAETQLFNIKAGNNTVISPVISALPNNTNFFNCTDCSGLSYTFGSHNQQEGALTSTLNAAQRILSICNYSTDNEYFITLHDILRGTETVISHENGMFSISDNLNIGTYVFEIRKLTNGISSINSAVFIFHGNGTSLGNSSSEEICVGSSVFFNVDNSNSGIGRNYPGSEYIIDFGDGSKPQIFTQSQLMHNPRIEHKFEFASCSESGSFFTVQMNLYTKGILNSCDTYSKNGTGVSKRVNASQPPKALFQAPVSSCINKNIKITNNSIPGYYGTSGCKDASNYYWYYKKPGDAGFTYVTNATWIDANNNLTIPADVVNKSGCWEIKLEAQNQDLCQTLSVLQSTVLIEEALTATFTASSTTACSNDIILFTNTSTVLNNSCSKPAFKWVVSPENSANSNGYAFTDGGSATSQDAAVMFAKPGYYNIKLEITNACGKYVSTPTRIFVYGKPDLKLSSTNYNVCVKSNAVTTIDFGSNEYKPQYSTDINAIESYNWSIGGTNITSDDYEFINNTTANSPYPVITFKSLKNYSIEIKLTGKCDLTASTVFTISLNEMPEITAQLSNQRICSGEKTADVNLVSNLTNAGFKWFTTKSTNISTNVSNGEGILIPGQIFENNSDSVGYIKYDIIPYTNVCTGNAVIFYVYVQPRTTMLQPTDIIAKDSEKIGNITFSSNISHGELSYNWNNSNTETGLATNGTGNIPAFNAINQGFSAITSVVTVVPTNTANAISCTGETKTFRITVLPKANISAINDFTFCNNETFEQLIFGTQNTDGTTRYEWTNTNTKIGLNASGTGNISAFKLTNNTDSIITAQISVTAIYVNYGIEQRSEPEIFSISVKPTPAVIVSGSVSACTGTDNPVVTFTGINGIMPYTFTYQVNNGEQQIITTNSNSGSVAFSIPTVEPGKFVYKVLSVSDAANICINYRQDSAIVIIASNPLITKQPIKQQFACIGAVIEPLTVDFKGGAGNTIVRWYKNNTDSNEGGTLIQSSDSTAFRPVAFTEPGKYYFYAIVIKDGSSCGMDVSETAEIIVYPDPIIRTQPIQTQALCKNGVASELQVTAEGGTGKFNYIWYKNTQNTIIGATIVANDTTGKYTPETDVAGTFYYFCEAVQQAPGCSTISSASKVDIYETPVINRQPLSYKLCKDEQLPELAIDYQYGAPNAKYQWYIGSDKDFQNAQAISGADQKKFQINENSVGTKFYFCTITFECENCGLLISEPAEITIHQYPVISNSAIEVASGLNFTFVPENGNGNIIPTGTSYTWTVAEINPAGSITGAGNETTPQASVQQKLINNTDTTAFVKYTVKPVSESCYAESFELIVKVQPNISILAEVKNISCTNAENGSISVQIQGGIPYKTGQPYSINWTGENNFKSTNNNISNLQQGNYTLTVNDSAGLTYQATYTIIEPKPVTILTDSVVNIRCNKAANGSISITPRGGTGRYTISWLKDGISFSANEDIEQLEPGFYQVIVTDENNCQPATQSYQISEPEAISIVLKNKVNNVCFGEKNGTIEVEVTGGTPDYTYSWAADNGFLSSEKNITNLAAGTYQLTVKDANGCEAVFSTEITQNDELMIGVKTKPVSCYGANDGSIELNISGGNEPYNALWNNLATGFVQENLSPGKYGITVTDASGCSKTVEITISNDSLFYIVPEITQVSCHGAKNGRIKLNIKTKSAILKLKWSDGSTAGNERNNLAPGVYTVEINNGGPCVITESFNITEPTELYISGIVHNALSCDDTNGGSIDLMVNGGTPPYEYNWSEGITTKNRTDLNAGIYFITVTDANGCSATESFEVIRPLPIKLKVDYKYTLDCNRSEFTRTNTASVSGGVPPYKIAWSDGNISGESGEIMTSNKNQTVFVTATDSFGCSRTLAFNNELPVTGIQTELTDCEHLVYQFNIQIPDNSLTNMKYLWEFGDGTISEIQNPVHTYMTSGNFNVKLHLTCNECNSTLQQALQVDSLPVLKLDRKPLLCRNDSVVLRVSGAKKYIWSNGTTGDRITVSREGNYSVTGQTENGCSATLNFDANYYENLDYKIFSTQDVVTPDQPTVRFWSNEIENTQYRWDFGDSNNEIGSSVDHTFDIQRVRPQDVKLNVTNPFGCPQKSSKRIWLITTELPNTFTPNGDGINDLFMQGTDLEIYNVSGVVLYKGTEGWDGKYKGKNVPEDTYYYVVYFYTPDGAVSKPGYITLIR